MALNKKSEPKSKISYLSNKLYFMKTTNSEGLKSVRTIDKIGFNYVECFKHCLLQNFSTFITIQKQNVLNVSNIVYVKSILHSLQFKDKM